MSHPLTRTRVRRLKAAFHAGQTVRQAATTEKLSWSTVSKYFGIFRGRSMTTEETGDRIREGQSKCRT